MKSQLFILPACFFLAAFAFQGGPSESDIFARGPYPIVAIDGPQTPPTSTASRELRKLRNKKHNLEAGHVLEDPSLEYEEMIDEWHQSLPALPVNKSDIILLGKVTNTAAYLSDDKHMVYSEFEVWVGHILKNSTVIPINEGDYLDTERTGGAVRFPSGRTWHFRVFQQGFPVPGSRYIFFLNAQPEIKSYYLVTGYKLDAKISPLDGVGYSPNRNAAFLKYEGIDQWAFLDELRDAIEKSQKPHKLGQTNTPNDPLRLGVQ